MSECSARKGAKIAKKKMKPLVLRKSFACFAALRETGLVRLRNGLILQHRFKRRDSA